MPRHSILSLLLLVLLATICRAQSDTAESAPAYRFSVGVTPALSIPLGESGARPGDPLQLFDSSTAHGGLAMTCSFRIIDQLSVVFAVEAFGLSSGYGLSTAQRTMAEATYPDYFVATNWVSDRSLFAVGGGLSYRIPIGPLSLEPSLRACYGGIDSLASSLELKRKGTNEYRSVVHKTEGREGFLLIPSVALRYTLQEPYSRWGVELRSTYLHAQFDIAHTITEKIMEKIVRSESFTARHRFDALNIGFGVYYYLF